MKEQTITKILTTILAAVFLGFGLAFALTGHPEYAAMAVTAGLGTGAGILKSPRQKE